MRIMVVDGQGGGIGKLLVEGLRAALPQAEILAVGTNAVATANMMRAGATAGASGENAIAYNAKRVDVIVGPVGVYFANSMLGEISPGMATALSGSAAMRIAIPVNRGCIHTVGVRVAPLKEYIAEAVALIEGEAAPR